MCTTCVQHVVAQCAWQQKQEVLSWSGSEAMLGRKTEAPHSLCGGEQVEDTGNNRCVFLLLTGANKGNESIDDFQKLLFYFIISVRKVHDDDEL